MDTTESIRRSGEKSENASGRAKVAVLSRRQTLRQGTKAFVALTVAGALLPLSPTAKAAPTLESLRTRFLPSIHGFHFPNDFINYVGPITTSGRCGGMAFCSLDYFYAGQSAPNIRVVDFGLHADSGPAATVWPDGTINLFMRQNSNWVAQKRWSNGTWSDWSILSKSEVSLQPSAASWGQNIIDLEVHGKDNNIWQRHYNGSWDGGYGDPLGGSWVSSPAIAAPFPGRREVYARGSDNNIYLNYFDNNTWHGWANLGHPSGVTLNSDPATASQYGWMNVLVRGSDNAIWQREWANGWQPWRSLGGICTSAPAIASPFPGRLEAYVRGTDNGIWINIYENSRWGGWASLGSPPPGVSDAAPAAISRYGLLDVYVRANDNTIWHRQWSGGGWQNWASVELPISSQSRKLTDAIYKSLLDHTITPITEYIAALALGPIGLPIVLSMGSVKKFVDWRVVSDETLFDWSSGGEMQKLLGFLRAGKPMPLGLLDSNLGHEIVAYGADVGVQEARGTGSVAGPFTYIWVYDNNYPDRNDVTLKYDPNNKTITSSTGEKWRGVFVRDDYTPSAPPNLS